MYRVPGSAGIYLKIKRNDRGSIHGFSDLHVDFNKLDIVNPIWFSTSLDQPIYIDMFARYSDLDVLLRVIKKVIPLLR